MLSSFRCVPLSARHRDRRRLDLDGAVRGVEDVDSRERMGEVRNEADFPGKLYKKRIAYRAVRAERFLQRTTMQAIE
jgi:hypothetical protein